MNASVQRPCLLQGSAMEGDQFKTSCFYCTTVSNGEWRVGGHQTIYELPKTLTSRDVTATAGTATFRGTIKIYCQRTAKISVKIQIYNFFLGFSTDPYSKLFPAIRAKEIMAAHIVDIFHS